MNGENDASGMGPLQHHGAEAIPLIEFVASGGLPVAAAMVVTRLRALKRRRATGSTSGGLGARPDSLESVGESIGKG